MYNVRIHFQWILFTLRSNAFFLTLHSLESIEMIIMLSLSYLSRVTLHEPFWLSYPRMAIHSIIHTRIHTNTYLLYLVTFVIFFVVRLLLHTEKGRSKILNLCLGWRTRQQIHNTLKHYVCFGRFWRALLCVAMYLCCAVAIYQKKSLNFPSLRRCLHKYFHWHKRNHTHTRTQYSNAVNHLPNANQVDVYCTYIVYMHIIEKHIVDYQTHENSLR